MCGALLEEAMKVWHIVLALILSVGLTAGCTGGEPTTAPVDASLGDTYTSEALDVSYPDAINASSQLMLGTLKLEGTENAVTAEQAKALLPLWQVLEAGGLQSGAERSAVLKQIEGEMSSDQLQAIASMRLSPGDMRTWAQEQGVNTGFGGHQGASPDGQATP
jgi:hypothetical protein